MFRQLKSWIVIFIISFLCFEGVESLAGQWFDIHLDNWLAATGPFVIVFWGFKLHIFCCLLPALFATYKCVKGKHDCCHHEHN